MNWNFIVNTFRYLRKNKGFTAFNILGLAVGFTCAILIIVHVSKENSYNKSLPEYERVYNLLQKSTDSPLGNTTISYALTPLLADQFPEIEYFARTENYSSFSNCIVSYQAGDKTNVLSFNEYSFCLADNNFFQIMQYPFIEGTLENAFSDKYSVVLSEETAKRYFGEEKALGKKLILNNEHVFNVTGVVEIPEYVTFDFSMIAPITSLRSESKLSGWDSNGQPFIKLNRNIDYKAFNKRLEHFYSEYKPKEIQNPELLTLSLLPITERHMYHNKGPLYLLIFIGFVILIVSVLNYVNMSTSMVQKRTSEIALKKISGASKKRIGFEFMQETAVISFIAVVLGMLLSITGLPVFRQLTGSNIEPYLYSHLNLFFFGSLLLWLIVSLLSGFYPAMVLSGLQPLTLFKKGQKSTVSIKSKNILITFQFVVSILLVIITFTINRQYRFMAQLPLGFDNKLVLEIPLTNELKAKYLSLKDEFNKIPTVKSMCSASSMPAGVPNHSEIVWVDEKGERHNESFAFAIVSEGYTQTFNMQMALGNEFISERPGELNGVIINEAASKILGFENPIGKQIQFSGKYAPIVGIVKDFQNNFIFNRVKPMIISAHPDNQNFTKYLYVGIKPGNVDHTIKEVENAIKRISPDFPFEYYFTSDNVEEYIHKVREVKYSSQFASFISILLAVIGLIALTYQATLLRTKEIGIRKVNGAKEFEIVTLLNSSVIKNIIIAYLVACPIAWIIVHRLLEGIENKTTISVWVFLFAGLVVGSLTILTVSWQSWRAATRNPVEALRYE